MGNLINIRAEILEHQELVAQVMTDDRYNVAINAVIHNAICALKAGNKIMLCGNGGSAADAQHIAGELVSRFYYDRPGLPAIALTTDTSILTAIGNDMGYDQVFGRQVQALGREGDQLWAYSTSGQSANVLEAVYQAKNRGITVVAFTRASETPLSVASDYVLGVPSTSTPRIQEIHALWGHIICAEIERSIFPPHTR